MTANGHASADRRERILSFVKSRGHATVAELVSALDVSESTIKRDLKALDARHMLVRTRGGAFLPADGQVLLPFEIRLQERYSEKLRIAREAAGFVSDNDSVFIEAGSTTYLVFKSITARDVTVITNSIPILTSLDRLSGLRVHVIE
ncbi:MAG: DeoR/GlpR family DNA-binding transcription regulator, partial [Bacillota bacterium]